MLKVIVLTQSEDKKFWQDTFLNVWEGPIDITLQKSDIPVKKAADLIVVDFSGQNGLDLLSSLSGTLIGRYFLMVSDKKDADLAIEGIKLGAIGFLVKPFKRFDIISSLDRLNSAPPTQGGVKRKGRVITLTSYKGGTGVSTATANFGYVLAEVCQKKTLIIDAAGFSNHITVLLNSIPKCTIADICKQGTALDEGYLTNAVSTVGKNLSVMGGLLKTTDYNELNSESLERLMEIATETYDFILIDTSTHVLDDLTMFFINKASDLLLLTTFDLLTIRDNRFYIETLKELGVSEIKIKPVINRQDWYIGSLEPELIQKQLNHTIFHSLPNDWQLCVEAANYGRPVIEVSPDSKLSTSFKILASKFTKGEISEQIQAQISKEVELAESKKEKKKGLLNWF